jgi:hypothetical protein
MDRYMRRKAYLLLELLIACSLLALCAVPLIRNPMQNARGERLSFEKIELQRLSEVAFARVFEKFHKNEIPWEAFSSKTLPERPYLKDQVQIDLPGISQSHFERKIYLWTPAQKEGPANEEIRNVKIKISFTNSNNSRKAFSFSYRLLLEKEN